MSFDRSKYKAAPISAVNAATQTAKNSVTYFGGTKSDYAPFFKNEEGDTIKRVLPAHNPGDSPYVPMYTALLECEVDEKNQEGQKIGKKLQKKKIFIATLHGGFSYDIIEEYIKRVYEKAEQLQDKDEKARFLNPVTGYRMGKTWVSGIRPSLEYVFYAYINGQIYRDSLKPKQMEKLNQESASLCAQNDSAAIDMFSDPTEGFPILWTRRKDDKGKTVEELKALPLPMSMSWDQFFDKYAVSDKTLEDLEKFPSLKELYVNSYSKKDFQYALDGLKRFDEKNNYGIFADEEYLDLVEKMSDLVDKKFATDEESSQKTEAPAEVKPSAKKALRTKKESEGPTIADKLKVINEEFVRQYGDEYEELTEEDVDPVDEMYEKALAHKDLGFDIVHVPGWDEEKKPESKRASRRERPAPAFEPEVESEAEKGESEPAVQEVSGTTSGMSALERIRAMRAAAQKK